LSHFGKAIFVAHDIIKGFHSISFETVELDFLRSFYQKAFGAHNFSIAIIQQPQYLKNSDAESSFKSQSIVTFPQYSQEVTGEKSLKSQASFS
jgi:hypothetical protein